jgi:NAD-dependent SIR2 family protein deacetylase
MLNLTDKMKTVKNCRPGGWYQVLEHLPSKYKAMSLNISTTKTKTKEKKGGMSLAEIKQCHGEWESSICSVPDKEHKVRPRFW